MTAAKHVLLHLLVSGCTILLVLVWAHGIVSESWFGQWGVYFVPLPLGCYFFFLYVPPALKQVMAWEARRNRRL
ncbi:MAG: hypothetical protein HZB26_06535 [Candidatus Hydrogenedentes bacterium]|nr:hypothetical protein [Candidatus Hydrogenedentota bacterium]